LAIFVFYKSNKCCSVWIIFNTLNSSWYVQLVSLEIHYTVKASCPTAFATHSDPSGIVPTAVFAHTFCERFNWAAFPKLGTVNQNQPTLAWRRWFVRL
jgi:hypothetical protein